MQVNTDNGYKSGSGGLLDYLCKEDDSKSFDEKTHFFNDIKDHIKINEAERGIDNNKGRLGDDEYKHYMLIIAPSDKELAHLLPEGKEKVSDLNKEELKDYETKLTEYTREVMDNYASSFGRGVEGKDLVYYAKIEHERKYKGMDEEVKNGDAKSGELKKGNQSHVHVVVSRYNKEQDKKLSPLTKKWVSSSEKMNGKAVQKGFNHVDFRILNEKSFDEKFNYNRLEKDSIKSKVDVPKLNVTKAFYKYKGLEYKAKSELHDIASQNSKVSSALSKSNIESIKKSNMAKQNSLFKYREHEEKQIEKTIKGDVLGL